MGWQGKGAGRCRKRCLTDSLRVGGPLANLGQNHAQKKLTLQRNYPRNKKQSHRKNLTVHFFLKKCIVQRNQLLTQKMSSLF